ncbi:MAG: hypothetical protein WCS34_07525 [Bacteroidales bacterium]
MKYIIRSLKFFLKILVLLCIIIFVMTIFTPDVSFSDTFSNNGKLFSEGSLPKMLAFLILCSAIYPALTYVKKEIFIDGSYDDFKDVINEVFELSEYVFVSDNGDSVTYRKKSKFARFNRLYEDQITLTKGESPLFLSGLRKDLMMISNRIEYKAKEKMDSKSNESNNL